MELIASVVLVLSSLWLVVLTIKATFKVDEWQKKYQSAAYERDLAGRAYSDEWWRRVEQERLNDEHQTLNGKLRVQVAKLTAKAEQEEAPPISTATVKIVADTTELDAALNEAQQKIEDLNDAASYPAGAGWLSVAGVQELQNLPAAYVEARPTVDVNVHYCPTYVERKRKKGKKKGHKS